MGLINTVDHLINKFIFSLFWFFIDPLDRERLFNQLKDTMDRNVDASNPYKLIAPDNYEILINNKIFIKHAHSIAKLETVLIDRLQRYTADIDYELQQPRIKLQILSSATISRHKSDIRCWFSSGEDKTDAATDHKRYQLTVIEGEGKGTSWEIAPGNTYQIGRISTADICLPYDNISKNQATLFFVSENDITIVDEGSANGTFIDDVPELIKGSHEIKIGSKIQFCQLNPIVLTLLVE